MIQYSQLKMEDKTDLLCIGRLHKQGINQGFLSTLGEAFLKRLYATIVDTPGGIVIVARDQGEIVGFVSGTQSLNRVYVRFIKMHWPYAVRVFAPIILKKLKHIIELVLYPSRDKQSSISSELLSIVVSESYRGTDVAKNLFQGLIDYFHSQNIFEFKIIVGAKLNRAISFYEKMGAVKFRQIEVHSGEKSWEMRFRWN